MTAVKSALVIGGGIAGPVTAMALQKAGIEVTIFEAYDGRAANVGGAFTIATNGLDALDAIDALAATEGLGFRAPRMQMYNADSKLIGTLATGIPRSDGVNSTSFRRADMFSALNGETKRRGIRTEYGKKFVRYTDNGNSVTAYFSDGSTATADVLIGADGIHSQIRNMIDSSAPSPRYTGLVSFGGFAANPGLKPDPTGWHMTFGRKAFLGLFVPNAKEVWWFVNVPKDKPLSKEQIVNEGVDRWSNTLIDLFKNDKTQAETVIRATGPAGLIVLGAQYDLPDVKHWHKGRVVIVGDAAHAASTSSGQGASMAMESAVTLGRALRDCATTEEAFTTYADIRRKRAEKIIAYGQKSANSKAAGPFSALMRDTFMGIGLKYFYKPDSTDAWLLSHHIDFNAPVQVELATV